VTTKVLTGRPSQGLQEPAPAPPARRPRRLKHESIVGMVFVLPVLVLFVVFRIAPAVSGVGLSLFDYEIAGDSEFVGLENFTRLFADPVFRTSLGVTLVYTLLAVPLTISLAVALAMGIRREFRGSRFFRSVFFLPVITSLVLAGAIFGWIFSTSGPWSAVLGALGLADESWLGSRVLVIPVIVAVGVWSRFGYGMLIVLAALQDVPREIEEAALMDGANAWQRFRYIIFPHLKPVLFFLAVIETSVSFQVFDLVYVLTQGGPARGSYTLVYMLYDYAFRYSSFGYAAAIGVVLLALTLAAALVQRRLVGTQS
jgi:multiple sugar transport system permease protein